MNRRMDRQIAWGALDNRGSDETKLRAATEELKRKARELGGGEIMCGKVDSLPAQVEHDFWKRVVAIESAPRVVTRQILAKQGFKPAPLAGLSDEQVTTELWRLIEALAGINHFLQSTDHLSDRQLYQLLLETVLEEETEAFPPSAGYNCHICVDELGIPGGEDGESVYLRYYAEEHDRVQWAEDYGTEMPPHVDPPYDRDRHLPKPY